jgi:hypothetical protein
VIWQGNHSGTAASAESVAAEEHFRLFEEIRREAFLELPRNFDDGSRTEIDVSFAIISAFIFDTIQLLQDIGVWLCIDGDTKLLDIFRKFHSFKGYFRDLAHVLKNIGSAFYSKKFYVSCVRMLRLPSTLSNI